MGNLLDVLRTEKKYRLNLVEREKMVTLLSQVLAEDSHSYGAGYRVRSLYFDTPQNTDFYDKLAGLECRRKIRLRIYEKGASTGKLELKEKQGALQRKRSVTLDKESCLQICRGDYTPLLRLDFPFALELYTRMEQYMYQPKCIVEYDRKAFAVAMNDTRVTFDSNLRANFTQTNVFSEDIAFSPIDYKGYSMMEVKYNHFLPAYVKRLVSLPDYMQVSASKYVMARNIILQQDF